MNIQNSLQRLLAAKSSGSVSASTVIALVMAAAALVSLFLEYGNLALLFLTKTGAPAVGLLSFPALILGGITIIKINQCVGSFRGKMWAFVGMASVFILFLFLLGSFIMFIKGYPVPNSMDMSEL